MAAAVTSTILVSKALNGPVTTLKTIGSEQMGTIGGISRISHPRQHFQPSVFTIAKPSGVVVRAGKLLRAPHASTPTPSVPSPDAVPTRAINKAPFSSYSRTMPSAQVRDALQIELASDAPEIQKDKAKQEEKMKQWIEKIRDMFRSMNDGEISTSPYDTAWVALVPACDGSGGPQFPKSLQWIIENQFSDGSWGDLGYFSYSDRVCNTLACIVALKTWKTGSDAVERGVKFIQKHLQAMETEKDAHLMIGFEIVFPALISYAQKLELDLPYEAPVISKICVERQKKFEKIPMDILHQVPTTLLHSLEGLHEEVDWEKILKLQSEDGSFLQSPAATAACLLHIKDEKALGYLNRLLDRFNNAVPNVYPVDLFEHMWIVDRLQRLGIARHFEKEIKDALDYVYKYFTSFGIGWARRSSVQDLDDTAMGFRLLRQHGYDVHENVFRQFVGKDNEFFCFAGQSGQAVTGIFNLYRAAQIRFPGETILETAEEFARNFLADKVEKNECFDKWIITKDLAGEVVYALDTPWSCSVPRLETAAYLDHYGPHDIWIGKSLYRMPFVNNETFLALAKADFDLCQAVHQLDLEKIIRWGEDCGFGKLTFARVKYTETIFSAACLFPGPESAQERSVWARNCVLTTVVDDCFDLSGTLPDLRRFVAAAREWDPSLMDGTAETTQIVFHGFYNAINAMTQEGILAQGYNIGQYLQKIWLRYLEAILAEAEWTALEPESWPSFDEYMKVGIPSVALEPIVLCTLFFLGEPISDEFIDDSKKLHLMDLVNRHGRIINDIQGWKREYSEGKPTAVSILLRENSEWSAEDAISHLRLMMEEYWLEIVREVHQPSHIPKSIRQAHFNMARMMSLFYKTADGFYYCTDGLAKNMKKVLYQPVQCESS